ncbi:MAG: hypothetical protein PHW27_07945, partial [Melioribacteraceae bacterium]|nr:hypothetical protein [Melioribacteraceae bacterium]
INENTLKYWESEVKTNKIILQALKDVGDGIAWRLFNYDRSLIYNMCVNGHDPGPLTLNQGLLTELHSLGDYTNDPDVLNFVYHGITNFLLISDLTISLKNGEYQFIEVKSGKPRGESWKKRLERQEKKADNIVNLANKGEGLSSNVKVKIRKVDKKPKTVLNKLNTLLESMNSYDIRTQIFYSYLAIAIINFEHVSKDFSFDQRLDKVYKQIKHQKDDLIVTTNSVENFIFSPNRAPLSVHPFNSETIANILLGKYFVYYFFNVTKFTQEIEKHGWKVFDVINTCSRQSKLDATSMFSVKKENFTLSVPPALNARSIYEGLAVESLIAIFEDAFKTKSIGTECALYLGFEKERYVWE